MKTTVTRLSRLVRWQYPVYHSVRRLTLILAITLFYGVLFFPLHYFWGEGISLLSVIPVAVSGWFFGSWAGIGASLFILLFNAGLWSLAGVFRYNWEFGFWVLINLMTSGLVGYIAGRLSEFRYRAQPQNGGTRISSQDNQKWMPNTPGDIEAAVSDIADFMPGATLIANRKGQIIAWNPAMESLTNLHAQDVLNKTTSEVGALVLGEDHRLLIDFALGKPGKLERDCPGARWEDKDLVLETFFPDFKPGGAYISQKARPIFDLDGIQVGAIQFLQDVTEVRLAQERQTIREQRDPVTSLSTYEYFIKQIDWLEQNQTFPNSILLVRLKIRGRNCPI